MRCTRNAHEISAGTNRSGEKGAKIKDSAMNISKHIDAYRQAVLRGRAAKPPNEAHPKSVYQLAIHHVRHMAPYSAPQNSDTMQQHNKPRSFCLAQIAVRGQRVTLSKTVERVCALHAYHAKTLVLSRREAQAEMSMILGYIYLQILSSCGA